MLVAQTPTSVRKKPSEEALSEEQFSHRGRQGGQFPRTAKTERTGQTVGSLLITHPPNGSPARLAFATA